LKIEGEFPSCFQNMTRLTKLDLDRVRGSNPQPIPFPTQFCNMIYLKNFTSGLNNFSGFWKELFDAFYFFHYSSFIGQISIDLTRMVGLEKLNLSREHLLKGFF